ncbi:hypothetical protein ACVWZA_003966 [Sphingomonas sp. UYAg733]
MTAELYPCRSGASRGGEAASYRSSCERAARRREVPLKVALTVGRAGVESMAVRRRAQALRRCQFSRSYGSFSGKCFFERSAGNCGKNCGKIDASQREFCDRFTGISGMGWGGSHRSARLHICLIQLAGRASARDAVPESEHDTAAKRPESSGRKNHVGRRTSPSADNAATLFSTGSRNHFPANAFSAVMNASG